MIRLAVAFMISLGVGTILSAQKEVTQSPGTTNDVVECALTTPDLVMIKVKVFDRRTKQYLNNLSWREFAIVEGKRVREVEYFKVPGQESENQYVLGFTPDDTPWGKWRRLEIRLKTVDSRRLAITVVPDRYQY